MPCIEWQLTPSCCLASSHATDCFVLAGPETYTYSSWVPKGSSMPDLEKLIPVWCWWKAALHLLWRLWGKEAVNMCTWLGLNTRCIQGAATTWIATLLQDQAHLAHLIWYRRGVTHNFRQKRQSPEECDKQNVEVNFELFGNSSGTILVVPTCMKALEQS